MLMKSLLLWVLRRLSSSWERWTRVLSFWLQCESGWVRSAAAGGGRRPIGCVRGTRSSELHFLARNGARSRNITVRGTWSARSPCRSLLNNKEKTSPEIMSEVDGLLCPFSFESLKMGAKRRDAGMGKALAATIDCLITQRAAPLRKPFPVQSYR